MSVKLKVCTFNLRVEAASDGINTFSNRRGRVLDTIREYSPDIIGFQEASDNMRAWLIDSLSDYIQRQFPGIKGFNRRGLYRMKHFYETYAGNKKMSALLTQLN